MKKKNREINIFSMSALDLFASAMGAFLLIAVMALPYYLKTDKNLMQETQELKKEIKQKDEELKKVQKKLEQSQSENEELKKKLKKCEEKRKKVESKMQKELSKTFGAINMSWESSKKQDVDMYITDPNGRSYSFNNRKYDGSEAMFTVDSRDVKNGAEVWITSKLNPGKYKIYYKYYAGSGSVDVSCKIFTKSFTKDLPNKRLTNPSKNATKIQVATINVDSSGNATLEVR